MTSSSTGYLTVVLNSGAWYYGAPRHKGLAAY